MVQEIKQDGRLKLSQIGGCAWNSVEGEVCTILTSEGRRWSGTVLPVKASVHVHGKAVRELEREGQNMEVRLDARTTSASAYLIYQYLQS
jgi:putative aminopeptidase FrvX